MQLLYYPFLFSSLSISINLSFALECRTYRFRMLLCKHDASIASILPLKNVIYI